MDRYFIVCFKWDTSGLIYKTISKTKDLMNPAINNAK